MSFINPSGTFENESHGAPATIIAPTTGSTVVLKNTTRDLYVVGTLAALNLLLPTAPSGTILNVYCAGAITALSVTDRLGVAITTAPTAATAGQSFEFRFIGRAPGGAVIGWVRWR